MRDRSSERGADAEQARAARATRNPIVALVGLVALLALFLGCGLRGLDFGHHWDEGRQIELVEQTARTGRLLPHWYRYPSMTYWLALAPLAPEAARAAAFETKAFARVGFPATAERLTTRARTLDYKLAARRVFLVVSGLCLAWTFLAVWRRRGAGEALLAAGLLGTSFELGYHARWIAPDVATTQFAALTACLLLAWYDRGTRRWLVGAAIAAGLAASTKYTAGLLLVPVLAAALAGREPGRMGPRLRLAALAAGAWAVTYLVVTPGTLLEPVQFYQDLRYERHHYQELGHYGHTVAPGLEHYRLLLLYLGTALFSPYWPLALAAAVLALVGAVAAVREAPRRALVVLLAFPVLYALYFGTTRVLFVRNLLVLAPFLAILAARGAGAIAAALPRPARIGVTAALVLGLTANAVYLVRAAESIPRRRPGESAEAFDERRRAELARELAAWVADHPELRLGVSEQVGQDLRRVGASCPPVVTESSLSQVDAVAVYTGDGPTWGSWRSNTPRFSLAELGARDINFDWYTTWQQRRVLVLETGVARSMGIVP